MSSLKMTFFLSKFSFIDRPRVNLRTDFRHGAPYCT